MSTKKKIEPADMEAQLERAFQPVQPSRTFVKTVRGRIQRIAPSVVVASHPASDVPHLLLVIGGVLSALLLLAAGARALFYMLNKAKM